MKIGDGFAPPSNGAIREAVDRGRVGKRTAAEKEKRWIFDAKKKS
jgi:hypothetical protein